MWNTLGSVHFQKYTTHVFDKGKKNWNSIRSGLRYDSYALVFDFRQILF